MAKLVRSWEVWSRGDDYDEPMFIESFADRETALRRIKRLQASQRRSGYRPYRYELRRRKRSSRGLFEKRRSSRDTSRISPEKQRWISRKIRILRREGYPQDQAVAIAYRMAGVPQRRRRT